MRRRGRKFSQDQERIKLRVFGFVRKASKKDWEKFWRPISSQGAGCGQQGKGKKNFRFKGDLGFRELENSPKKSPKSTKKFWCPSLAKGPVLGGGEASQKLGQIFEAFCWNFWGCGDRV